MKTKIVYVVASLDSDVYMEQTFVSAWSARYHNPDCHIVVVCDQDTHTTMQSGMRKQYADELLDEVIVREFKPEQCMMERSRRLKTSLRQIVEGDFLFLDSDTVVCADLSEVDRYEFDLGMVPNNNCLFKDDFMYDVFAARVKAFFGTDISNLDYLYNSGVIFVRDTEKNHEFFDLWFSYWESAMNVAKMKDQPALCQANIEMGYTIVQMSGDMNCQVQASIQYLHTAKVVHFFSCWRETGALLSPFFDPKFYASIKQNGLTSEVTGLILNCKSTFNSPICLLPAKYGKFVRKSYDIDILDTHSYAFLTSIKKHPELFLFVEKVCNKLNHLLERFHS